MKLVISRKGFDSGTGGCPSPVFPDGSMCSLPIPGGSPMRYTQIQTPCGPMAHVVSDLSNGSVRAGEAAHLDPDLWAGSCPRLEGWRPSLGQVGAAQSHLASKGVGAGDVFLFFGWFRPVEKKDDKWRFVPGAPDMHTLFGYMQVDQVLHLGATPDTKSLLAQRPWLEGHPHATGTRRDNNSLYIASERLVIDGVDTGLPGGGAFPHLLPDLVLTAPGKSKSVWRVPQWLKQAGLSYHGAEERWEDEGRLLRSVAKGQEFVSDIASFPEARQWLLHTIQHGLGVQAPKPARSRTMRC